MLRETKKSTLLISALAVMTGLAFADLSNTSFQDVQRAGPEGGFYTIIQTAQRLGLAIPSSFGACLNSSIPPGMGSSNQQLCPYFGPDTTVTRAEAAYWIVRSQMDENAISAYLCASGGDPSGLSAACASALTHSTFADVGPGGASIVSPFPGVTSAQLMRYIEVMARRGYTKGCSRTNDGTFLFCPNDPVNRGQVAVFIIRAKMNTVFPTSASGLLGASNGDNFGFRSVPYFTDVSPTDPEWGSYFPYIQKMRELAITVGTSATTYSPGLNVTRKEIATFAVRAFFL